MPNAEGVDLIQQPIDELLVGPRFSVQRSPFRIQ
jgi:hypothetical protein